MLGICPYNDRMKLGEPNSRRLARISHSVEAHRGANQQKFFCENDFAMIQGMPRCRQSVAQSSLILERWKAAPWKRPLWRPGDVGCRGASSGHRRPGDRSGGSLCGLLSRSSPSGLD